LKNGLKEANTASAFRAINSGILSIMKSCREVTFLSQNPVDNILYSRSGIFSSSLSCESCRRKNFKVTKLIKHYSAN